MRRATKASKGFALFVAFATLLILVTAAQAGMHGMPTGALRAQSNTIRRAIKQQVDIVIKPRMVVARGATGPVTSMAVSRDEHFLLTGVGDNSLRLWDLNVGREIARFTGHTAKVRDLAISGDNRLAASVDATGAVMVWNLADLSRLKDLPQMPAGVARVGLARNGGLLVMGDEQGRVTGFDLNGMQWEANFQAHRGNISAMAVDPAGAYVISAGADGRVVRSRLPDGAVERDLPCGCREYHCLSLGEKIIAGGGGDGRVYVWEDGREKTRFKAHDAAVTGVWINESRRLAATGSANGEVKVFSLDSGKLVKNLGRHDGAVAYVQMDQQGQTVLTASEDGATRLWHVPSGQTLVTLISTSSGWAVVDSHGRFEGDESSVQGIEWQDGDHKLPMPNFSEKYYEPALLPKMREDPKGARKVADIKEGVHLPPLVEVVERDMQGQRMAQVDVIAQDQGNSGVDEVRLYHNGKRVASRYVVDSKREDDEGPKIVERYEVPLAPGDNVLSAVAVNKERLESSPSTLLLDSAQPQTETPKLRLLVVGVNDYQNPELRLDYAAVDAKSLSDFFVSGRRFPFAVPATRQIYDRGATKAGILAAMRELRQAPVQDVAVVYLAGHGVSYEDEWYFIPSELVRPDDPRHLTAEALSSAEISAELTALAANRVLLIIDACQSGGAVDPVKPFQGMRALRMLARNVGVHILAATDRDQYAVELEDLGHGIFTYALLKGLEGYGDFAPRDGLVSVQEAMRFVEQSVPFLSKRYADYLQYPTAHSRGFDFTISYNVQQ